MHAIVQHICNTIYLNPAISLAIQLRFQYFKHLHVALDLQNMVVANKMNSSEAKGLKSELNARPPQPKCGIIPLDH